MVFHHVLCYQSYKISNCSHGTRSYLHKTVLYAMSLPRLITLLDKYILKSWFSRYTFIISWIKIVYVSFFLCMSLYQQSFCLRGLEKLCNENIWIIHKKSYLNYSAL
jgi:hypothetical protein